RDGEGPLLCASTEPAVIATAAIIRANLSNAEGMGERSSPNENKMSDGGRGRASLGVKMWKSFQKWSVQRSDVRSIAWLDGGRGFKVRVEQSYHRHRNRPSTKCQKRSPQNAAASPKNAAAHNATSQPIAMSGRIHQTNIKARIGPNTAPKTKRTQNSNRSRGGSRFTVSAQPSNENKMSDGGRGRASIGVKLWKSYQKWSAQRSGVRSIAWLDRIRCQRGVTAQKKETCLDDAQAYAASATVTR
ncbi:MAG: hypothetical protein QOH01_2143, partial [Verrucomicrobiota bacterium]